MKASSAMLLKAVIEISILLLNKLQKHMSMQMMHSSLILPDVDT